MNMRMDNSARRQMLRYTDLHLSVEKGAVPIGVRWMDGAM